MHKGQKCSKQITVNIFKLGTTVPEFFSGKQTLGVPIQTYKYQTSTFSLQSFYSLQENEQYIMFTHMFFWRKLSVIIHNYHL